MADEQQPLLDQDQDKQDAGLLSPAEVTDLAKKLKSPESKVYLDQMRQLSESPEYQRSVPPDTSSNLKSALDKAQQMYDKKATTNEWLEVAQTLGRAVAQFGAARAGMAGGNRANMANLDMGAPIDYGARTDRAFREYQQSLRSAGDEADRARQNYLDTETARQAGYGKREDYLKSALKNAQEIEGDEARFRRTQELERQRAGLSAASADRAERKMQLSELSRQEGSLQKQLQEAQSLANTMLSDEDLTKKSKDKLQEKYGAQAARAGIDPSVLAEISEQSKDEGILGTGLLRGEDKKKKASLVNEKVMAPLRNMLDSIQSRKKELLRGGAPVEQAEPRKATEAPASSGADPKIQQYADQYKLSYEQAKKILAGRGYTPAE